MAASILKGSPGLWVRSLGCLKDGASAMKRVSAKRAVVTVAAALVLMTLAPTRLAQQDCTAPLNPECPALRDKVDIAFIIDGSGSMAIDQVGQTYNVQVDGLVRALRDPSVIPRDGSAAASVWTFAGDANVVVPFTEIGSAADAEAIAMIVEGIKCTTATCSPADLCPVFGSNPASNFAPAISKAYKHLSDNHRAGARQALLLSSDGHPTDMPFPVIEANVARGTAEGLGIQLELDLILMTLDPDAKEDAKLPESEEQKRFKAYQAAKIIADQIVFPGPTDSLPGKTIVIKRGICNTSCASLSDGDVRADCDRQIKEFAENTRDVLRSSVPKMPQLIVNTEADPVPNTPLTGSALSLRQAIEVANCNGGGVTITFTNEVKTIRPLVPLPALIAPGIQIDGLSGRTDSTLVAIDGSKTDTTNCEQVDGILIRANRDVVRGLRILNFKRAGVGVEPVRLLDNVGFNRIELNTFEGNTSAGVCVIDPPQGQKSAVAHNVGNTISMNNISGSATPIDLALDGPTPNDPGDLDEGPNTLLNFPDNLSVDVVVTASGITFAGKVSGPTAAGATIEVFSITSVRRVSGGRAIDGVTFLKQATTNADGSFSVTGLGDSPTCGYTATVTDIAGNTSELMFPGDGFAKAKITNLDFMEVAVPNGNPQAGIFTIENTGFAPLVVSFLSVTRDGFQGNTRRSDDRDHFEIPEIDGQPVTIEADQTRTFTVMFNPAIPRVRKRLSASQLLPETIASTINLEHNGCAGSDTNVRLTAHVDRKVRLIDPENPRNEPLVTLTRSGDEFVARLFIFDSNRDVDNVKYEFEGAPLDNCCASLTEVQDHYVAGQSFSVTQKFSNASQHKNVSRINVTVCDKDKNCSTASGQIGTGNTQSLHQEPARKIILSPIRIVHEFAESRVRHQ